MTMTPKTSDSKSRKQGKAETSETQVQTPAASTKTQNPGTETTPAMNQPAEAILLVADVGDTPTGQTPTRKAPKTPAEWLGGFVGLLEEMMNGVWPIENVGLPGKTEPALEFIERRWLPALEHAIFLSRGIARKNVIDRWCGPNRPLTDVRCHVEEAHSIVLGIAEGGIHLLKLWHFSKSSRKDAKARGKRKAKRDPLDREILYQANLLGDEIRVLDCWVRLKKVIGHLRARLMRGFAAKNNGDDTALTLKEFMQEFCVELSPNLLERRIISLHSLAQRKKITLEYVEPWDQGQSKKHLPSYLKAMWPTYRKRLPTLPDLK